MSTSQLKAQMDTAAAANAPSNWTTLEAAVEVLAAKLTTNAFNAASPPAIGSTTPAAGSFTSLSATSGIRGETSNGSAATGKIGEYLSSPVPIGSAIAVTTTTQTNIASIVLTGGDWDVTYDIIFGLTGATGTYLLSSVSLTSATLDTTVGRYCEDGTIRTALTGNFSQSKSTTRFSIATGATLDQRTIYMIAFPIFTLGTVVAYGELRARRSANVK